MHVVGLDAPDAGTATIGGRPYRSLHNPLCHVGSLLDAGALQPGRRSAPLPAGLDAQATAVINSLPLTPWQGLGVVALWTAGAVLVGALALKFRDA